MRQKGFSLTELSFVLTITLILSGAIAGGGSYMMKTAKAQEAIRNAQEFFTAYDRFLKRNDHSTNFFNTVYGYTGATISTTLCPHLKDCTPAAPKQWRNPYTGVLEYAMPVETVAANAYPTNPVNFGLAGYPGVSANYKGQILWFVPNSTNKNYYLQVWDGDLSRQFQYFAVQVVDDRGYPLITLGR